MPFETSLNDGSPVSFLSIKWTNFTKHERIEFVKLES